MDALSLFALAMFGAFSLGVMAAVLDDFIRQFCMRKPIPVTAEMIAREFREQRCIGSAVDAITNPLVRRCLEMGARARAAREAAQPRTEQRQYRDAKSRAANDQE